MMYEQGSIVEEIRNIVNEISCKENLSSLAIRVKLLL